ncbi:hypothetical protein A9Q81_19425 [Gammaproteobacteria bacterium 42_54_T18]|nr:hypothetical protein A9Q81_19425 [Gammaproteobacteria bacterium 42_54_T18]
MTYLRIVVASLFLFMGSMVNTSLVMAESAEPSTQQVVNINTANAETLSAALKGIGLKKAQAIVAHREQYGQFKTLNELTDVKGIGAGTIAKNEAVIAVK